MMEYYYQTNKQTKHRYHNTDEEWENRDSFVKINLHTYRG